MKRILLVAPAFRDRHRVFEDRPKRQANFAFMAPVSIATVAAMTPSDFEVDLWDENTRGAIDENTALNKTYDLVGVTGFASQLNRVAEISALFRKAGITVAIGGPGASTTPERYVDIADVIFIGEAEYIWPAFLKDWQNGKYRKMYRQVIKPELSASRPPRWDLLANMRGYLMGAVQTSRGCPYDCEFCDVPYIFGHRSRWKPVADVLKEIELQQKLGVRKIFFCDDNFIGDLRYVKTLLKELVVFNASFDEPVSFFAPMTLNVAKHDDILELMADAGFAGLFIGIETPNKESLKETKKVQNVHTDIMADVRKVQSYGLALWSGVMVGFDHDGLDIFDIQFDFVQEGSIPMPMVHLLTAPSGTRLWYRLQREGRLLEGDEEPAMPKRNTNVIPTGMTRVELLKGHLELNERIRDWNHFAARMKGYISGVKWHPKTKLSEKPTRERRRKEAFGRVLAKLHGKTGNLALGVLRFLLRSLPGTRREVVMTLLRPEVRNVVFDIVDHTMQHAPWMFPERIAPLIFMQLRLAELLRQARPAMLEQIELESRPGFELQFVTHATVIPEKFNAAFNKVFPDVYRRVQQELTEKSRVEEVLIEIFTDFLSRWGAQFEQFEDYHRIDLDATCGTIIANNNRRQHSGFVNLGSVNLDDFKRNKLPQEILHSVEQELRLRPGRDNETPVHAGIA